MKAIIEHVCQILPSSDGEYCFPLVHDYVRSLVDLLQYRAHVEHLTEEDSNGTVQFCLTLARDISKTISDSNERSFSDSQNSRDRRSISVRPSSSALSSGRTKQTQSYARDGSADILFPQLQNSAANVAACLQHLFAVPCTPRLDNAEAVISVLFELIRRQPHVSALQQPVFETINSLMPTILTNDTSLALSTLKRFLSIIRPFWSARASGLKEAILRVLLRSECIISSLMAKDDEGCTADLSAFLDTMRLEYTERRPKELLLLEDIDLNVFAARSDLGIPHDIGLANIRPGAVRAEEPWALVRISCAILLALENSCSNATDSNAGYDDNVHLSKRRRVTTSLDEVFVFLKGTQNNVKTYALQVIAFIFSSQELEPMVLLDRIEEIVLCLSDEDNALVSWALFTLAWSVHF